MTQTLAEMVRRNALLAPNGTAVLCDGQARTYADYARRCHGLGAAFLALGAQRQDRIAILATNCPEYVEVYGACELAGLICATINFRLAAPEIAWILADASPAIVVFEAQYAELLAPLRAGAAHVRAWLCIGAPRPDWALGYEDVLQSAASHGLPDPAPEDCCTLIYTSGTTGRPKGVMRSQRADAAAAERMAAQLSLTGDSRMLLSMPFFHIGARSQYLAVFWRRATVMMHRRFDPAAILDAIERDRITHIHLAPTMVKMVLDVPGADQRDVSSLRILIYAAAPMPVPLLLRGIAVFGPVFLNGYGMTESNATVLYPHQHRPDGSEADRRRLGSVGQAADGIAIRLVDETGADCPPDVPGEIWLRSDSMLSGYWNNHAATIEAMRDGWFRSGDIGKRDEEGFLYLVDRKKDMIISGGENIYCREVEAALAAHPAVGDVAVIGVADAHWGQVVKAIIVLAAGEQASAESLTEHCRSRIARYKCPKSFEFVADLPRLPSGKVNKIALRQRYDSAS